MKKLIFISILSLLTNAVFINQALANSAPVWDGVANQAINIGQLLEIAVSASDPDGDGVTYSAVTLPAGASFDSGRKLFSWRPTNGQGGRHTVALRAYDGINNSDLNFIVVVSGGSTSSNLRPYWTQIPAQYISINQTLQFTVNATDPESDFINYSASNLPNGAFFNNSDRLFIWTPNANQIGNYTVTFRAADNGGSVDMNVSIAVSGFIQTPTPFPGAPIFINFNPPLVVVAGQTYTYRVQAVSGNSNPVAFRIAAGPAGLFIDAQTGLITWIPSTAQVRTTPYAITVAASNGQYESTRSFAITVLSANGGGSIIKPTPTGVLQIELKITDIKISQKNSEVVISWKTNKPARSRVIYDTKSHSEEKGPFTYESVTPDPTASELFTNHEIKLTDLKERTKYYFRAVSKTNVQTAISDEMSFETSGEGGLALLVSFKDFLSNPWLYIILAVVIIWIIYRRFANKAA